MFIGHYAAALAAKGIEPRAPLWTYIAAAQVLDVGWSSLVLAGVEKFEIDPSLPGNVMNLYHMPWSHSLPAAVIWSVAAALLAGWALKLPRRAATMIGLVVFSHWFLDFLVHRPDLALWVGGPKVGLAWWNFPVAEQAVEIGLLAVAGAIWSYRRGQQGLAAWGAPGLIALMMAIQVYGMFFPPASVVAMGLITLAVYLGLTLVAAWIDRLDARPA